METRRVTVEIKPDQTYSVSEAARFLGIHRCTIYVYLLCPIIRYLSSRYRAR